MPERYAALPLARCYEAAGRLELAERYFGEAVSRRPDDGATLIAAATFHLRLNHAGRAEPLLRRLLGSGTEASAADLAWAHRELAMVMAADGDYAKVEEAAAVLGAEPGPGEDAAAFRRARAFVLGARPGGREAALRRLEEEGKIEALPADERFRLARMYDAAGAWPERASSWSARSLRIDEIPNIWRISLMVCCATTPRTRPALGSPGWRNWSRCRSA